MSMFTLNSSFVIFGLLLSVQIVNSTLCSNDIVYDETTNDKYGEFEITFENPPHNSFLETTVFVTDDCKSNMCILKPEISIESLEQLYKDGRPIRFILQFRNASKNATITHIAIRNSTNCKAFCGGPTAPGAKFIHYRFYPHGQENSQEGNCTLVGILTMPIPPSVIDQTMPLPDPSQPSCGHVPMKIRLGSLAMGGEIIERGSWPWLVALHSTARSGDLTFICGATLISGRAVLTAAHCVEEFKPDDLIMLMGKHDRSNFGEEHSAQYYVHDIIIHSEYRINSPHYDSDIAILIADREIKLTDYIHPACLWNGNETIDNLAGQVGTVVGWSEYENKQFRILPMAVRGKIVNDTECIKSHETLEVITTRRNFCAGSADAQGPCERDSGGAFILNHTGVLMVRGVVNGVLGSEHDTCGVTNHAIYTDVAKFVDWINEKLV